MSDQQNKFMLNIMTPEKKFLEDHVSMVTVPAFEGEIGILKNTYTQKHHYQIMLIHFIQRLPCVKKINSQKINLVD